MSSIKKQAGTGIYGSNFEIAGSVSTFTKVAKPDEYDFNLPLEVDVSNIKIEDSVKYGFDQTEDWYDVSRQMFCNTLTL